MKNKTKQVSIVIPNYNGIKFIKNCLQSLEEQTSKEFDIIIVDNASTDGSLELIKQDFGYVKLIELDKNYGFCKAVNEGIRSADSDYVILLNNDTEADKGFVEELVKAVSRSNQIFSCSAKMLQLYHKELIDDAGDYYCSLGWAFARGKGKAATEYTKDSDIFAACAGAAIYRKSVFEKIGYFDEEHFAYLEDIDVGYRAKLYGFRNCYAANAVVYHAGSGVSGSAHNEFKVRLASRNSIYLIYKNMPILQILLNLPFLLAGFMIKTVFFTKKGLGITYVKGLIKGIKMCIKSKKVKFKVENSGNYVTIQLELWANMVKRLMH